ncbi:MAG: phosphoribosylamine--glycine ligase [Acidobacteriaceae bacterium]
MSNMKILVIGGGGREHAIVWALRRSSRVNEVVCAPGNAGIAQIATCVPVQQSNLQDLLRVVAEQQPDLTVIGPELPLSLGLVDELRQRGLRVFGPTKDAAQLETSKAFAKEFMQRHQIPTAHYAVCDSFQEATDALKLFHAPLVVKADGLAAGKGVVICQTKDEALAAAQGIFDGMLLGVADRKLVLEEFLEGEEVSFLVLCDGKHVAPLVPAQDHKRIGEGDTGPNTGGMGAYSTDDLLDPAMSDWLIAHVAQPVVDGMAAEGTPFTGILYCGLMMTARGPMVIEFNTRFGDPETQAVLMRLDSDILDMLLAASPSPGEPGGVGGIEMRWKPGASACIIAASAGYPGSYTPGRAITGLDAAAQVAGVVVFHSGTATADGACVTAGGRVLGITAAAPTLQQALSLAYQALGKIHFEGMQYRRDIGHRALDAKL